ncbi:Uncharacterised protein [Yersinia aldovae]|nr:Uncharacterised protein [Yersinia aldovae]
MKPAAIELMGSLQTGLSDNTYHKNVSFELFLPQR